jgi:hypothetical protein
MIEHQADRAVRAGVLPWVAAALIGAGVAWVLGALPWLVDGMRLPISSGWPALAPEDEVRVALPFGEYHLVDMLVFTAVGGAVGVVAARVPKALSPASLTGWAGATGALLGLGLAMAQTLRTVRPLLADDAEARLLVTTLVGLGALGALPGAAAGLGIVRRSWWSPVGAALLAGCLGTWLVSLSRVLLGDRVAGFLEVVNPWLVGALVAGALIWTGWVAAGRWAWAWWPVVVALLWAMPAAFSAMFYVGPYARSGMGEGPGRAELVDATRDVFVAALRPGNHLVTPYVVGLLSALVFTAVQRRPTERGVR